MYLVLRIAYIPAMAYTLDTHATIRKLTDAGMEGGQAEAVVEAISQTSDELVTKDFMRAEHETLRTSMRAMEGRMYAFMVVALLALFGLIKIT